MAMNVGIWPPMVGQFVEARIGVKDEMYNSITPRGNRSAKKIDDKVR
jgi:hypothetical protein